MAVAAWSGRPQNGGRWASCHGRETEALPLRDPRPPHPTPDGGGQGGRPWGYMSGLPPVMGRVGAGSLPVEHSGRGVMVRPGRARWPSVAVRPCNKSAAVPWLPEALTGCGCVAAARTRRRAAWAASGGGRALKSRWSGRSVAYPAAWQAALPRCARCPRPLPCRHRRPDGVSDGFRTLPSGAGRLAST